MSRLSSQTIPVHKEVRPWTRSDYVFYGVIVFLAYALSPPWVGLFFKLVHAPGWIMVSIRYFYAPIGAACNVFPFLDTMYFGYQQLLKPWLGT